MDFRLETPTARHQYEQWVQIMERVSGDVFDVDEIAHVIESEPESAWLLATRGQETLGCGVGRRSSIAGSLYAMARVLPEHRRRGVGTALLAGLSAHAVRAGSARSGVA